MITGGAAPEPVEATDADVMCLCGHVQHPEGTCPSRACGCRESRETGSVLVAMSVLVACVIGALFLLAASHLGERNRCAWLAAHHSPATHTYSCTKTGAP